MSTLQPKLPTDRLTVLQNEFTQPYFFAIKQWLLEKKSKWETIYPPGSQIFHAFELTPFAQVKVVILGQDPYHGPGQAHGLSFSVPDGTKMPPSLVNIYKEIITEFGGEMPSSGNLEHWAQQGVLLLNAMLTVTAWQPASHQELGWQHFTDAIIARISSMRTGVVFMLWWNFAKSKSHLIDASKHTILTAPHPSPFSVHTWFFGCGHFRKANELLEQQWLAPIKWL